MLSRIRRVHLFDQTIITRPHKLGSFALARWLKQNFSACFSCGRRVTTTSIQGPEQEFVATTRMIKHGGMSLWVGSSTTMIWRLCVWTVQNFVPRPPALESRLVCTNQTMITQAIWETTTTLANPTLTMFQEMCVLISTVVDVTAHPLAADLG